MELEPGVAKRMFETKAHLSTFVQGLGLKKETPADLLEKLNLREQDWAPQVSSLGHTPDPLPRPGAGHDVSKGRRRLQPPRAGQTNSKPRR